MPAGDIVPTEIPIQLDQGDMEGMHDLARRSESVSTPSEPVTDAALAPEGSEEAVAAVDPNTVAEISRNPADFFRRLARTFRNSFQWVKTAKGYQWAQKSGSKIGEIMKKAWTWFQRAVLRKDPTTVTAPEDTDTATAENGELPISSSSSGKRPMYHPHFRPPPNGPPGVTFESSSEAGPSNGPGTAEAGAAGAASPESVVGTGFPYIPVPPYRPTTHWVKKADGTWSWESEPECDDWIEWIRRKISGPPAPPPEPQIEVPTHAPMHPPMLLPFRPDWLLVRDPGFMSWYTNLGQYSRARLELEDELRLIAGYAPSQRTVWDIWTKSLVTK